MSRTLLTCHSLAWPADVVSLALHIHITIALMMESTQLLLDKTKPAYSVQNVQTSLHRCVAMVGVHNF